MKTDAGGALMGAQETEGLRFKMSHVVPVLMDDDDASTCFLLEDGLVIR